MTDIARLINSIKRRTSSARELGYDVLFVALDDLDVLADSLETALRANAAQAAHIEQLQDKFNKLAAENVALKRVPETDSVAMLLALDSFRSEPLPDVGLQKAFESLMYHRMTPATDAYLAGIKADGVEEWVSSRGRWNGTTEEALNFAKQLREGGKV
ncbi:hypothetical protein ACYBGR_25080 [Klebsiella pneumoniae]